MKEKMIRTRMKLINQLINNKKWKIKGIKKEKKGKRINWGLRFRRRDNWKDKEENKRRNKHNQTNKK